jgi:serine/threonine-protein kinase ULK/ATG1
MGPEILSYKKYDAKADLWSVGAVLYEMVAGRPPFRAQNHLELLKKIQENNDVIRFPDEKLPDARSLVGDDLKDLIRKLLKKDPIERISFEEFFAHPAVLNPDTLSTGLPVVSRSPSSASSPHLKPSSTPPRLDTKYRHVQSTTPYEAPPFAQPAPSSSSPSSHQDPRKTIISSSPTRQHQSRHHR